MEKNIHNDRLDDYVKKSFDDYIENPADDMWDRIEGQLPPVETPNTFWLAKGYRWSLVAATVILLLVARLVCVESYYEEKLRQIQAQQTPVQQEPVKPNQQPSVYEVAGNITDNNQQTSATQLNKAIQEVQNSSISPELSGISNNSGSVKGSLPASETNIPSIAISPDTSNQNQSPASTPSVNADVPDTTSIQRLSPETDVYPGFANFDPLTINSAVLYSTELPEPNRVATTIKKFKAPSGWYAGISITPHLIVEKPVTARRPNRFPNPRMLFANQQEKAQLSANVSLRVGKKINNRFALESGLGFQRFSRNAQHLARFEYRDGHTIQNPNGIESRRFDYDLNTYGGSASVSLRTELAGTDVPGANERIVAVIASKEDLQMVQFPLLGVIRLGHNRLQTVLKAGLVANYLTKNTISLRAFALENHKLRLRNSDGFSVQLNRPQQFILGYQLAAGLEFRLNKNLNIAAVPTLLGDFNRMDARTGKLPAQTSFGMNLGVNYWF